VSGDRCASALIVISVIYPFTPHIFIRPVSSIVSMSSFQNMRPNNDPQQQAQQLDLSSLTRFIESSVPTRSPNGPTMNGAVNGIQQGGNLNFDKGARKEMGPTAAEQDKKLKESVTAIKNSMIKMNSIEMQQKAHDNPTPALASLDSMSSNSMVSMASVDPASIALAVASSSHCDLINNKRPAPAPDLSRRARPRMSPDSKGETKEIDNFIKPALAITIKPELKPLPPKSAAPVTPSGQKTKTSGKGSSGKAIGQAERWQLKYRDLLNFRSLHGTCSVPSVYPEDPQLASWVYRQRTQYRYKKRDASLICPKNVSNY